MKNEIIARLKTQGKHILASHRFWVFGVGGLAVLVMLWAFDGTAHHGDTKVTLLSILSPLLYASGVYLLRKVFIKGSSDEAWEEVKRGNHAAGAWAAGAAIASGLFFIGMVLAARAGEIPPNAIRYLPVLESELDQYWPDCPDYAAQAAQVEQETCPSLKSPICWNPLAELKTAREYGFGLPQITITSRFNNFEEAKRLDRSLASWTWEKRFDPARQLRVMGLMVRRNYNAFSSTPDPHNRQIFAMVGYNRGPGGLRKERQACSFTPGCDPDQWFGHVELHPLGSKVPAAGYKKSFADIRTEYPRNIFKVRRPRYAAWFGEE